MLAMSEYYPLIDQIAEEFHVVQGDTETESSYLARVIYSLLGRMGYASLWDIEEEGTARYVSIEHFKHRICNVLKCYCDLYPDMQAVFLDTENLCDEIGKIYSAAGVMYHKSNQFAPAIESEARVKDIVFTRGKKLSERQFISGIGTYMKNDSQQDDVECVTRMFQLQAGRMDDYWLGMIKKVQWRSLGQSLDLEYLRTAPAFTKGYWVNHASTKCTSLARTRGKGNPCYYIYRYLDKMMVYQLSDWLTRDGAYRALANGCLMDLGSLPKSQYSVDGSIVILKLGYLYPKAELDFLSLYSWPMQYKEFGKPFTRIFSSEVFFAIKAVFETMGYEFMEEK